LTATLTTNAVAERFIQAVNDHDVDAALELLSADSVFESTSPAPCGTRYIGRDAIRAALAPVIEDASTHFAVEQWISAGDDLVVRWRYDYADLFVRGISVLTIRDGEIVSNLAYVKG
jgi:ketosteroid isomerase-like protein